MSLNLLQPHPEYMHRAEPTPAARAFSVFADLVRRDRGSPGDSSGRHKQRATAELAYIYHMCDYDSPYFRVPPERRSEELIREIFGEDSEWAPDELVEAGLDLYRRLSVTPSMKLLEAANITVAELEHYFRSVDFDEQNEKGQYKYAAKDVMSSLEKLAKLVDSLAELRKQVEKERQNKTENWGGVELNEFNRG